MSDAILFVGYEESTGAVLSVAGVTVLGVRGAYSPPILAAKSEYEAGYADGCTQGKKSAAEVIAASKRGVAASAIPPVMLGMSAQWNKGYSVGWKRCYDAALKAEPHIIEQGQSEQTSRAPGMPLRARRSPAQEIPIFPPSIPQSNLQRPANSPLRATIAIPTHSMFDYRMR